MASKKHIPAAKGTVEIVLLDGGGFITGDDTKIHANGSSEPFYMYDWCFYIYHKATGQRILWDLGISDDRNLYTPFILNYHWPSCNPVGPRRRLVDQLADLDVAAETIDAVIFSHAHWDHCRPPKHEFPNAKIVFGPGTASHCSPGHMLDGDIRPMVQWDSRFFGDKSVQTEFFDELEGRWTAWCSFDRAMDYFGDGSLWIMDAPGHMPGNLSACARLASGEQVLLSGDCCHSRDIFIGRRQIANVDMPDGSKFCLHENLDDSLATIGALREAVDDYGMHIAMAHDAEFIKQGTDDVLMSILHPLFDESCLRRIRAHQRP
ncbi:beta-lactamase-like protein [Xylariales sp. AK1849]|nr:beta-lactamase-like protein [Xylariales sp. AK1849]